MSKKRSGWPQFASNSDNDSHYIFYDQDPSCCFKQIQSRMTMLGNFFKMISDHEGAA